MTSRSPELDLRELSVVEATLIPRLRGRLATLGYARAIRLVVGAGIFFRLALALVHTIPLSLSDAQEYNHLATNLVQHGMYGDNVGQPDASIPPGWPMLLAAVYEVVGVHVVAGQLLAAALECGALVCATLIATKLLRPSFALLAVAVLALDPVWIVWAGTLESEHLGLFLATAVLAIFVRKELTLKWAAAIGVLLGLLALNRSEVALCLLVGLLVAYVARVGLRRSVVTAAVTCGAIALVLTPWTIRNAVRFHEFIPTAANGGFNFYLGTISPYYTFAWQRADGPGLVAPAPTDWPPERIDHYYWLAGFHRVGWWPKWWLRMDAIRLREVMFYDDEPAYLAGVGQLAWPNRHGPPNLPLELYWNPINTLWRLFVLAAGVGAIWTLARWRRADPAWRAMVVFLLTCIPIKTLFASDARGHMTLITALILLGGLGTQKVWDVREGRRAARAAARA